MRNIETWHPTKYAYRKGNLYASKDKKELSISSRLMATIIARFYNTHLPQHANGRLLDLGCGKAPLYGVYKHFVTDIVCVDMAMSDYTDFTWDISKPLPFNDGEFDTIVMSDVLEHIYTPDLLFKEIYRVLADGGKLIMNVPFFYWIHEQPYDFHRYTDFALRRYAEENQFQILLLEPMGGAPEVIGDMTAKLIKHLPVIGYSLSAFVQSLICRAISLPFGRKMSKSTSRFFPIAYSMIVQK